jgi:hypothetical protein
MRKTNGGEFQIVGTNHLRARFQLMPDRGVMTRGGVIERQDT